MFLLAPFSSRFDILLKRTRIIKCAISINRFSIMLTTLLSRNRKHNKALSFEKKVEGGANKLIEF